MSDRKIINPATFRVLSIVLTGMLLIVVNTAVTSIAMKKVNSTEEDKFMNAFSLQSDGYSESVNQILRNATVLLNAYDNNLLSSGTNEQIHQYLIKTARKIPNLYNSVFFSDLEGNVFIHDGQTTNVVNLELYKKTIAENTKFYITDPYVSFTTGKLVLGFGCVIYDNKGAKKGALNATMSLTKFHELLSQIKIGDRQFFVIQNSTGLTIYHPDYLNITKQNPNTDVRIIQSNGSDLATSTTGIYEIKTKDNKKLLAFFNKLEHVNWYLALLVPESEYLSFRRTQKFYLLLTVIISSMLVLLAVSLELYLSNYFHKKDVIATIYDPLTNLYTRQKFEKTASRQLRFNRNTKYMLIETDIHGFKFINQNYGASKADDLLVFFAQEFNKIIEKYGGFTGRGYADHLYAFIKVTSVRKALANFKTESSLLYEKIKNYPINFYPKYGITFRTPAENWKKSETSIQNLIGQTTFAKSTTKDNIMTYWALYDQNLLKKSNEEHFIEENMGSAMNNGEFFVVYQPKINPLTGKIEGAEALVRWNSSVMGLMSPGQFIPLFEKNDFIIELDFYVYEKVFQFLRKCLDEGIPVVPVSLNMSRNHSKAGVFIERFLEIFNKYKLPENLIEIEILERSVLTKQSLLEITNTLHQHGFTVAMDDFGSGESSLNMLTNIPVDILKFDKTFLDAACPAETGILNQNSTDLIEGLITLSKRLKKKTLFEGVETEAQLNLLKGMECDLIQGFYFSKPIPEDEFITFVKDHI